MKKSSALGLWNMGEGLFHRRLSGHEAKAIIKHAYNKGIRAFDTAYSYREADSYLSAALREIHVPRDGVTIISKIMPVPTLERKAYASLRRLGTDFFDILLIHWPSDDRSIFSSLRALERLKDKGIAREIGVSNFTPRLLREYSSDFDISYHERALSILWNKGWDEEREMGIRTIAYSPLCMGLLADREIDDRRSSLELCRTPSFPKAMESIRKTAMDNGMRTEELAISYAYSKGNAFVVSGVSSPEQLSLLDSARELDGDTLSVLDGIGSRIAEECTSDNIFSHVYDRI